MPTLRVSKSHSLSTLLASRRASWSVHVAQVTREQQQQSKADASVSLLGRISDLEQAAGMVKLGPRLFSTPFSNTSGLPGGRRDPAVLLGAGWDGGGENVIVAVWWDIENCNVPQGVEAYKVGVNIVTGLRMCGFKGPVSISAYGDTLLLSRNTQEALASTGIRLHHIPSGAKDSSDRALLVDLILWALEHPPPAHLFLISGDRDFSNVLHRLRMMNYNILLACPVGNTVSPALTGAATHVWQWNSLAKGDGLLSAFPTTKLPPNSPPTSPNTPPQPPSAGPPSRQGLQNSAPPWSGPRLLDICAAEDFGGKYVPFASSPSPSPRPAPSTPVETHPKPVKVSPPSTNKAVTPPSPQSTSLHDPKPSAEEAKSPPRPIPAKVLKQLKVLVDSHPDGILLADLQKQMLTEKISFDKNFYGHSKLLACLSSLPDVLLVERVMNKDGKTWVHRVTSTKEAPSDVKRANGALGADRRSGQQLQASKMPNVLGTSSDSTSQVGAVHPIKTVFPLQEKIDLAANAPLQQTLLNEQREQVVFPLEREAPGPSAASDLRNASESALSIPEAGNLDQEDRLSKSAPASSWGLRSLWSRFISRFRSWDNAQAGGERLSQGQHHVVSEMPAKGSDRDGTAAVAIESGNRGSKESEVEHKDEISGSSKRAGESAGSSECSVLHDFSDLDRVTWKDLLDPQRSSDGAVDGVAKGNSSSRVGGATSRDRVEEQAEFSTSQGDSSVSEVAKSGGEVTKTSNDERLRKAEFEDVIAGERAALRDQARDSSASKNCKTQQDVTDVEKRESGLAPISPKRKSEQEVNAKAVRKRSYLENQGISQAESNGRTLPVSETQSHPPLVEVGEATAGATPASLIAKQDSPSTPPSTHVTHPPPPPNLREFQDWCLRTIKESYETSDRTRTLGFDLSLVKPDFERQFGIRLDPRAYGIFKLQDLVASINLVSLARHESRVYCVLEGSGKIDLSVNSHLSGDKLWPKMYHDCKSLVEELLLENPEGIPSVRLKPLFLSRFQYPLDHKSAGYPRMSDVLRLMSDVVSVNGKILVPSEEFRISMQKSNTKSETGGPRLKHSVEPTGVQDKLGMSVQGPKLGEAVSENPRVLGEIDSETNGSTSGEECADPAGSRSREPAFEGELAPNTEVLGDREDMKSLDLLETETEPVPKILSPKPSSAASSSNTFPLAAVVTVAEVDNDATSKMDAEEPTLRMDFTSFEPDTGLGISGRNTGISETGRDTESPKNEKVVASLENDRNIESLEDKRDIESLEDKRDIESLDDKRDIESLEDKRDIESLEDKRDIESLEDKRDIESFEDKRDIESLEDKRDIDSLEGQRDVESFEEKRNIESPENGRNTASLQIESTIGYLGYERSEQGLESGYKRDSESPGGESFNGSLRDVDASSTNGGTDLQTLELRTGTNQNRDNIEQSEADRGGANLSDIEEVSGGHSNERGNCDKARSVRSSLRGERFTPFLFETLTSSLVEKAEGTTQTDAAKESEPTNCKYEPSGVGEDHALDSKEEVPSILADISEGNKDLGAKESVVVDDKFAADNSQPRHNVQPPVSTGVAEPVKGEEVESDHDSLDVSEPRPQSPARKSVWQRLFFSRD